jgi:beta-glucosidase
VSVEVKNSGDRQGDEVVQLYLTAQNSHQTVPIRSLQGFQRIGLLAGEQRTITFTLTPRQLSVINEMGIPLQQPGSFLMSVGGKQPGFSGSADAATTSILTASFAIDSSRLLVPHRRPTPRRRP